MCTADITTKPAFYIRLDIEVSAWQIFNRDKLRLIDEMRTIWF